MKKEIKGNKEKDDDLDLDDMDLDDLDDDKLDKKDDLDKDFNMDSLEEENDGRMDLIRQLTSFDKDIKEMVSGWMGYEWDEEKKNFIKSPHIKPVCNMYCASWCTNHLRTYLRQTNSLINPTEQDYIDIMTDNIDLIYGAFATQHKEFGFKSTSDIFKVATQMLHSIRLLLSSTRNGGIKNLIKETHTQTERSEENKKQGNLMTRAANFLNGLGGK